MRLLIISAIALLLYSGCNSVDKKKETYVKSVPFVLNNQIHITQQLVPTDLKSDTRYGSAVSLDSGYLAVGAEYGDGKVLNSGAVYIYKDDGNGNYTAVDKLKGSDSAEWQFFGNSVSVSGNYVAVGAYLEGTVSKTIYDENGTYLSQSIFGGTGVTYIFKNDGNDTYSEIAKLQPSIANENNFIVSDATRYGYFGNAVSMNGNYLLIGSEFGDGAVEENSIGSAFIFKNDGSDNFIQIAKLTANDSKSYSQFGRSVAQEGNYAVVGAVRADGGEIDSGAAYVFKNDGNDSYVQIAKLTGLDTNAEDYFGASVAISGDYIAVGAYGDDYEAINSGAVYVFKNNGSDSYTQIAKITVGDASVKDWLGYSVSMKGSIIAAGAFYGNNSDLENSGAAYIFKNDGNDNYIQEAKLTGFNSLDNFGSSVALSTEGIAVGSLLDDIGDSDTGGAYIAGFNEGEGLRFLNYKELWQIDEDKNLDLFTVNAVTPSTPILYSLLGTDSSMFSIDLDGKITFNSIADFENPQDANSDNNYQLSLQLTDQANRTQTFNHTITIKDKIRAQLNYETNETIDRFSRDYIAIDGNYAVRAGDIYKKELNGGYTKVYQTGGESGATAMSGDYVAIAGIINNAPELNNTVKIFKNNGSDNFIHTQTLFSDFDNDNTSKYFAQDVVMEGDYLVISAASEGSMYIYKKDASGTYVKIDRVDPSYKYVGDVHPIKPGRKIAINGDTIFVVGGNRWETKVYILENDGSDNYPELSDAGSIAKGSTNVSFFGASLAVDGDYLLVSASDNSDGSTLKKAVAYLYKDDGSGTYTKISTIRPKTYDASGSFASNILIKGNYLVIASDKREVEGTNFVGSIFIFKKQEDDTFLQMEEIAPPTLNRYGFFGSYMDFDGANLIVTDKPSLGVKPKAYFYELFE